MNENKLRKFKLIDEEGYKDSHRLNSDLLRQHLENNCFKGVVDDGHLFCSKALHNPLISRIEFQFFEEVFEEEKPSFPQIGDRANYGGNKNCEIVGIHKDKCMLLAERGDYHIADVSCIGECIPLTEDEIITRGKVKQLIQRYTLDTALDHLMEEFTIVKKGK